MIGEIRDYYKLLGIPPKASGEDIRKAFRKLARLFHPDLAVDKIQAEEKFKEINEAYEVLGDPENRRKYDRGEGRWHRFSGFGSRHVRTRSEKFRSRARHENFRPYTERPEFRSFYEDFFGERHGGSSASSGAHGEETSGHYSDFRNRARSGQRGNDIEGEIVIALVEVLTGSIHTLSVMRNNPLTCEPERRPLHVRIPAGVQEGQVLLLAARGDYGMDGGSPGDLFLRVKFARHPELRVRGTDLLLDLELTPWEAFFGAKRTLPTLEGGVEVKVPAGTSGGQRLRLRGRGLPDADGIRGDLYALVTVKVRFKDIARKVFRRS